MGYRTSPRGNGCAESAQYRPKTQWYASTDVLVVYDVTKCSLQSCILCPNEGGAFKQTVSGDWVHLLCAIWVPETAVANDVFMEPITGVERISKQRWRLVSALSSLSVVTSLSYPRGVQCATSERVLVYSARRRRAS